MPDMTGRHVYYEGHVQGVGFRYTVRHIAKGYEIVGWVKNLMDGRVELRVSGEEAEVTAFLTAIRESELHAFIKNVQETEVPPLTDAKGFEITF